MNAAIRNPEVFFALVITSVAQIVFANYLTLALYLDLPLLFALYIGWYSSPPRGAVCGTAFGWVQDAISGTYLGFNGLSKTLVGFSAPYLNKWLVLEGFWARCLVIGTLSVVDNSMVIGMRFLMGQTIQQGIWLRVLAEVPVTGILGGTIFQLYDHIKFPRKGFGRS